MDKKQTQKLIELLEKGEEIPAEYQDDLFPTSKKEYELVYAGKERKEKIISDTMSVPFQAVKHFGKVKEGDWVNKLIFGDNLQALKHLLKLKKEGKLKNADGTDGVRLVYIDPPFGTGDEYEAKGGVSAYSAKLQGVAYLEYLRKRLVLIRELMSPDGILFFRIDYHFGHYMKVLMDEIFSKNNFRNELIINRIHKNVFGDSKFIPTSTDSIYVYFNSLDSSYQNVKITRDEKRKAFWRHMDDSAGHRNPPERIVFGKKLYPPKNKHFKYNQESIDKLIIDGRIRLKCGKCSYAQYDPKNNWSICPSCGLDEPRLQYLVEESTHLHLQSNWTDIPGYSSSTKYPTENSEALLERVLYVASNPGDIVLDCFAGSGTTGAVAEKLGRRWIMCDCGKLSIYTIQKRMMNLKKEIGNRGEDLEPKPFVLYNAGLYSDGNLLENMQKDEYKDFILELFSCQKKEHKIQGLNFQGTLNNYSVIVFDREHFLTEDFIKDLHKTIGKSVKNEVYIIAPTGMVGFNEDYKILGNVRYTVLRIPNSIIEHVRKKHFERLTQPRKSNDVNQTIDAIGFDFVYPPSINVKYSSNDKNKFIEINEFEPVQLGSKIIEFKDSRSESLAMVMIDLDYDGETFQMDKYWFGDEIVKSNFKISFEDKIGKRVMIIYIDIFGNENRKVLKEEEFN